MDMINYYSPFRELEAMRQNINHLFDSSMSNTMKIDVEETDEQFVFTADIPGFKPEEVEIDLTGDSLAITAEKSIVEENKDEERNFIHRERSTKSLRRRISLNKYVDTSKATSSIKDGVLTILLPKAESSKSVKLIPQSN